MATASYVYDAGGRRTKKTANGSTVYALYDRQGRPWLWLNGSGQLTAGEVWANGRQIGTIAGGNYSLSFADWLGTARARTDASGAMQEEYTSLPFGDMLRSWNGDYAGATQLSPDGGRISPLHFTSKPYDEETALDDFGARYHGGGLGRFMTPDPLGGQLEDPQSLNRYVYARDNPVTLTDSTGLSFALDCAQDNGTTCQGGHVYYQDKNGKYQETIVNSGKNDVLTDQQGNRYNGTFDGKQVTFTAADGSKSTGAWIQGSQETKGISGGGPLSSKFHFTFEDHGRSQQLHAEFTYSGTIAQAERELSSAGFAHWHICCDLGYAEWRLSASGRNSTHFLLWDPNRLEKLLMDPPSSVPQGPGTQGSMHTGEYYPTDPHHFFCDVLGQC